MNDIGNRDLRVDHKNVVLRHNFHQLIAPSDDTAHGRSSRRRQGSDNHSPDRLQMAAEGAVDRSVARQGHALEDHSVM